MVGYVGGIFSNYPEDIKLFHQEKYLIIAYIILFAYTGMSRHIPVSPVKTLKNRQNMPKKNILFFWNVDSIYWYMP